MWVTQQSFQRRDTYINFSSSKSIRKLKSISLKPKIINLTTFHNYHLSYSQDRLR